MNNSDMPAMPLSDEVRIDSTRPELGTEMYTGLSKREHFAGLMMAGFAANPEMMLNEDIKGLSVQWADALLAELEKGNG